MEGAESVQAQTMGEASEGVSTEPQSQGSGVSSAEPVAAEPVAAEPAVSETTEAVQESFPDVDSFSWDEWDGKSYEQFPEQVRSWADKIGSRHSKDVHSLKNNHGTELDYWKRMYEAMQYGDEDPRVGDMTSQLETLNTEKAEIERKYAELENVINAEREEENTRYFSWFEKNYEGKLEKLSTDHGPEEAEKMVLGLMDMGMDVHVAVEVSLMGPKAVEEAGTLAGKVSDTNLVMEILKNRYSSEGSTSTPVQATPIQEVRPPNPATQVIAGSAPVSRPAQLAKEKAPSYGSDRNQRMASLMSAAEHAIRKSKRR